MFDRIISVDWSGAGKETDGVSLRVAMHDAATNESRLIMRRKGNREIRSWSRADFRTWLTERLTEPQTSLICCDFGFGYSWNADRAIFGCSGWHELIENLGSVYEGCGTAREAAQQINAMKKFEGGGPFRFNESRNDFRFYCRHDVAYCRLTELMAPQAISQWYLGSGGTVGFHSITGLSAINQWIAERSRGKLDFEVWPHENLSPDGLKHVFTECYPTIYPDPDSWGECSDEHQRDAWKTMHYFAKANQEGSLQCLFQIPEFKSGRYAGVSFKEQVKFEGWILGLK